MNKRIKKKKHHHKWVWQYHMQRMNDERFIHIAKLYMSSVYGKCI